MQLTILGCGASMGVPAIGCRCAVCSSDDPRNRRTRTAALLRADGAEILIDAGPDLRQQALRAGIARLDAVLLTHAHQDHVGGIDDLRPINMAMDAALPMYGSAATLQRVRHQFDYAFAPEPTPSTRPRLQLEALPDGPFAVAGIEVTPLPIKHGDWEIVGFRAGSIAYVTDVSHIPEATFDLLAGVEDLVLGALRYKPHPIHFTIDQALEAIALIAPRRAWLTHMTHDVDYETLCGQLPAHVRPAHDGLVIEGTL
ncbi:MAG TPA: MBL fold metallo-hydrolase [Herpetosiphonaceae bacterium]|nr:MBL fold metallo-hydrolase [Herpetosiphonaceae bacterium]